MATARKSTRKKNEFYIDKKEFYDTIKEYIIEYKKRDEAGTLDSYSIPKKLSGMIQKISYNLARMPKFSGYTYKDIMISEGILHSLTYLHKFNYEKYDNPFAYFTQIAFNAFLKIINEEKKNQIRNKELVEIYSVKHKVNIKKKNDSDYNLLTIGNRALAAETEFAPIKVTNKKGKVFFFDKEEKYLKYCEKVAAKNSKLKKQPVKTSKKAATK